MESSKKKFCYKIYQPKKLKPLKDGSLAYVLDGGVEKGQSCDDRGNYEYDFLVFIHAGYAYPLLSQIAKDHFLRLHLLYLCHRHPTRQVIRCVRDGFT